MYKPEYFAALKTTRDAENALSDARQWLRDVAAGSDESPEDHEDLGNDTHGIRGLIANQWSNREVVTELGLMLKLLGGKCKSLPRRLRSPAHLICSRLRICTTAEPYCLLCHGFPIWGYWNNCTPDRR